MNPKEKGVLAEEIACKYLKKQGFKILDRNCFYKQKAGLLLGEIDIVAKNQGKICFFEVKSQVLPEDKQFFPSFSPELRINSRKINKIRKSAETWLSKNNIDLESEYQFDVISVYLNLKTRKARVVHFRNAF